MLDEVLIVASTVISFAKAEQLPEDLVAESLESLRRINHEIRQLIVLELLSSIVAHDKVICQVPKLILRVPE